MTSTAKNALIAAGVAATAAAGLLYYWSKSKGSEEKKIEGEAIDQALLCKILQYTKYQYLPILQSASASVRLAKEQMKYNESFAKQILEKCNACMVRILLVLLELKNADKTICDEYKITYKQLKESIKAREGEEYYQCSIDCY